MPTSTTAYFQPIRALSQKKNAKKNEKRLVLKCENVFEQKNYILHPAEAIRRLKYGFVWWCRNEHFVIKKIRKSKTIPIRCFPFASSTGGLLENVCKTVSCGVSSSKTRLFREYNGMIGGLLTKIDLRTALKNLTTDSQQRYFQLHSLPLTTPFRLYFREWSGLIDRNAPFVTGQWSRQSQQHMLYRSWRIFCLSLP